MWLPETKPNIIPKYSLSTLVFRFYRILLSRMSSITILSARTVLDWWTHSLSFDLFEHFHSSRLTIILRMIYSRILTPTTTFVFIRWKYHPNAQSNDCLFRETYTITHYSQFCSLFLSCFRCYYRWLVTVCVLLLLFVLRFDFVALGNFLIAVLLRQTFIYVFVRFVFGRQ